AYQRSLANSSITRSNVLEENYTFDNVLTYNKILGDHDLTAMAGFSFRDEKLSYSWSKGYFYEGSPFSRESKQTWYINNTSPETRETRDAGDGVRLAVYIVVLILVVCSTNLRTVTSLTLL